MLTDRRKLLRTEGVGVFLHSPIKIFSREQSLHLGELSLLCDTEWG